MSLNRLSGVVMLALGIALLLFIVPDQTETAEDYGWVAPATVPDVVAAILTLFAAVHVVWPSGTVEFAARDAARAALILALGSGALLLMERFSFLLVAPVLCAALMALLRERRPLWLATGIVGLPVLIWLIADKLLGRPLP